MEELIGWIIVIVALVILLSFAFKWVLGGLYWGLAVVGYLLVGVLDWLTWADLLPRAPWVMWMLWGALGGAALACWMLAPVYGLRHRRPLIALAPLALMLLLGVVHLFV